MRTALFLMAAVPCLAQVEFVQKSDRVQVRVDGTDFSELRYGRDERKPYLYPLRTASGRVITRGFPESPEPGDMIGTPHQRGIWVGHESVSGVDYFEVDPLKPPKHPVGSLLFKDLTAAEAGVHQGALALIADWVAPGGGPIIRERRAMRFIAGEKDTRTVDMEFRLHANRVVELSDHQDGILGLRLGQAFEERHGGVVRDFLGRQGAEAINGRRSFWITYEATIEDEKVAVTIMDHPDNYNFPTRWRVSTIGSTFASAFGDEHFDKYLPLTPGRKSAAVTLQPGQEMVFRYRIMIHPVSTDLEAAWRRFAMTPATGYTEIGPPPPGWSRDAFIVGRFTPVPVPPAPKGDLRVMGTKAPETDTLYLGPAWDPAAHGYTQTENSSADFFDRVNGVKTRIGTVYERVYRKDSDKTLLFALRARVAPSARIEITQFWKRGFDGHRVAVAWYDQHPRDCRLRAAARTGDEITSKTNGEQWNLTDKDYSPDWLALASELDTGERAPILTTGWMLIQTDATEYARMPDALRLRQTAGTDRELKNWSLEGFAPARSPGKAALRIGK